MPKREDKDMDDKEPGPLQLLMKGLEESFAGGDFTMGDAFLYIRENLPQLDEKFAAGSSELEDFIS
jgi:hypothetical protein